MSGTAQRQQVLFRVRPQLWIGFAIFVGYVVLVTIIQLLGGVPFPQWGDSGGNLFRGAGISLIVMTILLAVTTSLLGWWHPVLHERERSRARWPIFIPIVMGLLGILNLVGTDWGAYNGAFLAASIVLLLVGFTEEMTTRGLLLVALRSRLNEVWVWLLSSLLFALMHYSNVILGQGFGPTTSQVALAFGGGTIFYILRRTTGSLIPAMILHALWDFSSFATGVGSASSLSRVSSTIFIPLVVVGLICVAFVIRGANERISEATEAAPAPIG